MTTHRFKIRLAAAAVLALLIAACGTADIGRLRNSAEVGRRFETLQVSPDYRYWFLFLENSPYAVVGLERGYQFGGVLWTEVDPGSELFRKVVGLVASFPVPGSITTGAMILDPRGEPIGVWFSSMGAGISVDPETRTVSISTGSPWLQGNGQNAYE